MRMPVKLFTNENQDRIISRYIASIIFMDVLGTLIYVTINTSSIYYSGLHNYLLWEAYFFALKRVFTLLGLLSLSFLAFDTIKNGLISRRQVTKFGYYLFFTNSSKALSLIQSNYRAFDNNMLNFKNLSVIYPLVFLDIILILSFIVSFYLIRGQKIGGVVNALLSLFAIELISLFSELHVFRGVIYGLWPDRIMLKNIIQILAYSLSLYSLYKYKTNKSDSTLSLNKITYLFVLSYFIYNIESLFGYFDFYLFNSNTFFERLLSVSNSFYYYGYLALPIINGVRIILVLSGSMLSVKYLKNNE